MRQKSVNQKPSSERIVKDIRRSVSCWTAFGGQHSVADAVWDMAGQGNSITFSINACAWPKNSKWSPCAGSFWPVVWVARQTFLKWPPAFSRQSVFASRERR